MSSRGPLQARACCWLASPTLFAFAIYLLVLAKSDVSQIFPAAIGVNIFCVAIMAAVVFGEAVTLPRLVGMAVIVVGVYIVTRF